MYSQVVKIENYVGKNSQLKIKRTEQPNRGENENEQRGNRFMAVFATEGKGGGFERERGRCREVKREQETV